MGHTGIGWRAGNWKLWRGSSGHGAGRYRGRDWRGRRWGWNGSHRNWRGWGSGKGKNKRIMGILFLLLFIFVLGKAWDIAAVQTGKGTWPDGTWGKEVGERFFQGIWDRVYPSPLLDAETDLWRSEEDPAYRTAKAVEAFFQEHQYLEIYGNEETGETFADGSTEAQGDWASGVYGGIAAEGELVPEGGMTLEGSTTPEDGDILAASGTAYPGQIFPFAQLQDYDFLMSHFYSVHTSTTAERGLMDARKLLSYDFRLESEASIQESGQGDGPQILIYHTHSRESFADSQAGENIVAVGRYLTQLLTERGFSVYHDTSEYDVREGKLDRNKAYSYALEGITKILKENPSIQVVIDLHRDGVGKNTHLVTEINGKPTARIMFFNGLSQTPDGPIPYLANPYREENLAFSLQLQLKAAAWYPGFTRKIYLKGLRYNQHLRPRSCLIEAGAQTNTYQEVCNAMEPLADILTMVFQGK